MFTKHVCKCINIQFDSVNDSKPNNDWTKHAVKWRIAAIHKALAVGQTLPPSKVINDEIT